MNQNPLSPEDPRLTLYALGEMEPAERASFEKLLEQDAEARRIVAEIRTMAEAVTGALEHEAAAPVAARPMGKILRFPQLYFMISGLAAACFAVFFAVWQNQHTQKMPTQLIEVPITPLVAAKDAGDKKGADGTPTFAAEAARPEPTVTIALPESKAVDATVPMSLPVAGTTSQAANLLEDHASMRAMNEVRSQYTEMAARKQEAERQKTDLMKLASVAPAQAPAAAPPRLDEAITLQPFAVTGSDSMSYGAGATLGGSLAAKARINNVSLGIVMPKERDANTEGYAHRKDNDFLRAAENPLSTFSIDVDTASYANVRRFLNQGRLPPADAVRIEELVNYFPYDYQAPKGGAPFAASLEVASAPWAPEHRLVRIGLKGLEVADTQRPAANLVFLLDVSGSMRAPNKLPLVKQSLRLLVDKLRADDRVAIAVYAGASGLALPSTPASHKAEILEAIERLDAGGSTNGAMGIHLAYDIAKANFVDGGVNRVILATDGDFNVGTTSEGELVRLIGEKAKSGVFLSVLGFGMGNLKDGTLEQIADKGNGNYAYIDSLAEAKKTLVEQAGGTLVTIAKDVKIQVEFNPAQVAAYRLIGYENRLLAKEDFNNDQVDAGEIGAGHTVTALYEIVPVGVELAKTPGIDPLKYQKISATLASTGSHELLTVKIRYKEPAGETSSKLEFPLVDAGTAFADASGDFKFATAVAGFGLVLRDSPHKGAATLASVAEWGRAGLGQDVNGYRAEFLSLVTVATGLLR